MKRIAKTFEVLNCDKAFSNTLKTIDLFVTKNKLPVQLLQIKFDFIEKDYGCYHYIGKKKQCTIIVNPINCLYGFTDGHYRHPDEVSISSVIAHEFSHFVDDIKDIESKYRKYAFETEKLIINAWSYTTVEEIAEILTVFLLNPYLLKLIDKERYSWFSKLLKPIIPPTKTSFLKLWKNWSEPARRTIEKRFNIVVDEKKKTVCIRRIERRNNKNKSANRIYYGNSNQNF